jgi:hypothetical protein
MLILIISVVLLVAGIKIARDHQTYGSTLEQYITSRNPQNAGDVERLTVEYNNKLTRGEL